MKIKKILEQEAEQTYQEYRDPEGLNSVKSRITECEETEVLLTRKPQSKISLVYKKLAVSLASIVVVFVSVFCGVYFGIPKQEGEKEYFQGDQHQVSCELSEIQADMKSIQFNSEMIFSESSKVYDSVSGDVLYYFIRCNDETIFTEFSMAIVTNENFNYAFSGLNNPKQTQFLKFDLVYNETISENDGLYHFIVKGFIDTGNEKLYLTYDCIGLEKENPFIYYLSQMLFAK